jgi:hypothetical protein
LALVATVVAHLAGLVDHVKGKKPLVNGQVDLYLKIFNVLNEAGHDLSQAGVCLGSEGVDDMLGECLAEALLLRLMLLNGDVLSLYGR